MPIGLEEAALRLGVRSDAGEEQVARAFRRAVRCSHPDVGGDAGDFALAVEARNRLLAPRPLRRPVEVVTHRSMRARRWRRARRRALARVSLVRSVLRARLPHGT